MFRFVLKSLRPQVAAGLQYKGNIRVTSTPCTKGILYRYSPHCFPPPYPNTAQADCTDLCNVWIIPDAYICPYLFVLKVVFTDYQIKKVYLKSGCFFVLYNFVTHHEAIIN